MATLWGVSFFDRFRRRQDNRRPANAQTLADIEEFLRTREGVEAFVEPPTPVHSMSVCLVAADGEYLRRPIKDAKQARQVTARHGVPLYDARIVGYPKRMREYDRGVRSTHVNLDDLPPLDITEERRED